MLSELSKYISWRDSHNTLSQKERAEIAEDLEEFIRRSVDKYIKGKAEHGGHIADRNLLEEMEQEQIDQFWYLKAERRKRKE